MPKALITILMLLFSTYSFSQKVTFENSKPERYVVIVSNEGYYFFVDIAALDTVLKKHIGEKAIADIKTGKLYVKVTLDKSIPEDSLLEQTLTEHHLAYILMGGKAYIENPDRKKVTTLMMDKSPEMVELDGTARIYISFMDNEKTAFVGGLYLTEY